MLFMYLFMSTGVLHDSHITRCSCCNNNTTGVASKTGNPTIPEHLSSPRCLVGDVHVARSLVVYSVLYIIVCHFPLFLLTIVMSVLRFTFSDYIYNIFMNHSRYRLCLEQEQVVVVIVW